MKKSSPFGKTYFKIIIREIRKSFGRFIAIVAIVALGVGFLSGLLAATPNMKHSVDTYYDKNNMSDVFVKATMGLTDSDVQALKAMDEVEKLMPAYVTDALVQTSNNEMLTTRIYGVPLEKINEDSFVNRLELLEGRMPQADNECLVEQNGGYLSKIALGTVLTLSADNDDYENIGDIYSVTEYTVVGIVKNPFYISTVSEPSSVGAGKIGAIIYVNENCYALDVYTDFYITIKGAAEMTAFSDTYDDYAEAFAAKLKGIGITRSNIRYDEIVAEAQAKVDEAWAEYETSKLDAEAELADARKELDDGKAEIADAEIELADAEEQWSSGKAELKRQRASFERQINNSEADLDAGEAEIAAAKQTLAESKAQLDAVQADVELAKQALANGIVLSDEDLAKIAQYDAGLAAYESGMAQISAKETEIANGRAQLADAVHDAKGKFARAQSKLADAREEIDSGLADLEQAKLDLADGEAEYADGKAEMEKELGDAEIKIADAERKITEIDHPEWYVLDRTSNVSYASFGVNVAKVGDIATVFPIFFLLVAALVALTTMTRMVEEQRIQIGTLKALGYSKGAIMYKYLIYCGLASALGCIVGLISGFQLIPTIVFDAYATMFHLPPLIIQFNWLYSAISCVLVIFCTMGATIAACRKSLKEKPAFLMLPRAPKAGKRIFLERMKLIWSHMTFTYKATARNLIRNKRHFFMTVIGIAGCTALILTGFGLRDSMTSLTTTQYNELIRYDLRIDLNEDEVPDSSLSGFLSDTTQVGSYAQFHSENGYAAHDDERISTTILVPDNEGELSQYFNLRERQSGKTIEFTVSSVVLTEKLAAVLKVRAGDPVTLEDADGKSAEFTVSAVTENYVGCFVYVNQADYEKAFGKGLSFNTLFVITGENNTALPDQTITNVLESGVVSNAEYASQTRASYDDLMSSMGFVVIVLIIAAGALAVIVLYNLTNININERSKELATLRVLGFHHREVARYIFREITILSIVGTAAGLLLGVGLHAFIVNIADSVDMMFGREISPLSFVASAAITMFFSAAVDLLMLRKLRKIEMVESMKAVD